jgi:TolB-like protein/DNA-binding winged helix-turn-helix (wHTH) protein
MSDALGTSKSPQTPLANGIIRFGSFEVDLRAGELRRGGIRVKLSGQPFDVLVALLEKPGQVVTREELHDKLWAQDTFVDFEHGLNKAINKVREALGDDADNPRFVETLPRRGYRFVAPVQDVAAVRHEQLEMATKVDASTQLSRARLWNRKVLIVASAVFALVVVLAGFTYLRLSHSLPNSATQKRVMLAVLPFQNMSNDPGQEYFSDGLTEETITDLGQLSPEHLGVIARTSAMAYKHTNKSVSQIGRELGVDYILEGSVRRDGGAARVSAQLIRVSDQTHLWAQNYQRELHDLLQMENELGTAIARQVQGNLTSQQQVDPSKTRTVDPEAYDLYLKGRFYWNQTSPAATKESVGYFQQAIAKDPDFALAYVGLAEAYNIGSITGAYPPEESFPKARTTANEALALDPSLAEAHSALGMEKSLYEFDFPGAQKELLRAIELNPNSAQAHFLYSNSYLTPMGRMSEAITENKKALELDPLSLPMNLLLGDAYMFAGYYEESDQQFRHTIAMDPTYPLAPIYFSFLLKITGRYEEGIKENEKGEVLSGSSPEEAAAKAAIIRQALQKGGEKAAWQKELELILGTRPRDQSSGNVAGLYALIGDKDKAFEWLDKAYAERDGVGIATLKVDPAFKTLRSDPRFGSLLRRMGLQ